MSMSLSLLPFKCWFFFANFEPLWGDGGVSERAKLGSEHLFVPCTMKFAKSFFASRSAHVPNYWDIT